jgi:hypothetical protein
MSEERRKGVQGMKKLSGLTMVCVLIIGILVCVKAGVNVY